MTNKSLPREGIRASGFEFARAYCSTPPYARQSVFGRNLKEAEGVGTKPYARQHTPIPYARQRVSGRNLEKAEGAFERKHSQDVQQEPPRLQVLAPHLCQSSKSLNFNENSLDFNENGYTFALLLLVNVVLCSKFYCRFFKIERGSA